MSNEITSESLGKFAGIDEGLALAWLGVLRQKGLMSLEYRWYCPVTGDHLLTTATVDDAPDAVPCGSLGCLSHSHKAANECHVSLVFRAKE